jgi:hypothetical protein
VLNIRVSQLSPLRWQDGSSVRLNFRRSIVALTTPFAAFRGGRISKNARQTLPPPLTERKTWPPLLRGGEVFWERDGGSIAARTFGPRSRHDGKAVGKTVEVRPTRPSPPPPDHRLNATRSSSRVTLLFVCRRWFAVVLPHISETKGAIV